MTERFAVRSDVRVLQNEYVECGTLWIRDQAGVVMTTVPIEELVA